MIFFEECGITHTKYINKSYLHTPIIKYVSKEALHVAHLLQELALTIQILHKIQ